MTYQPHAVYLMFNEWSTSNYKVGLSNHPFRRHLEVDDQYGVSSILVDACWLPTRFQAQQAEKTWHKILSDFQTDDHGGKEWFSLPEKRVLQFRSWCSASMPVDALRRWIFVEGASPKDIKSLVDKIFKSLPPRERHDSISVWHSCS